MGWSQWRDLLRYRTLIQDSRKITIVIPNVVSSLQHLKDNEVCIPEELRPMMRYTRILFTGKGHERLDTTYVERIPSIEWYELSGPDFMGFLWSRPVTMLYYLLTLGAEIYVLKDPEDQLNVTWFDQQIEYATEPPEPRFRLDDLDELIKYTHELCGDGQEPTTLIKGRTDYLQLSDTADELDEETMARLRADEEAAKYRVDPWGQVPHQDVA